MKKYVIILPVISVVTAFAAPLNPFLVLAHLDEATAKSDTRIIQKINGNYRSAFVRLNPEAHVSQRLQERWSGVLSSFPNHGTQGIKIVFTQGEIITRIANEILVGNKLAGHPESRLRIYLAEAVAMGPYNAVLEYLIEQRFSGDEVLSLQRALKSRADKAAAALLGSPDELIDVLQRQVESAIVPVKEGEFRISELQRLTSRNTQIVER